MTKNFAVAVAVALTAAPMMASADTIVDPVAHVAIDIPDGWSGQTKGDMVLLADKHGDVAMSFVHVDAGAVKAASRAVGVYIGKLVDKLVLKGEKAVTIDGMQGVVIDGDGFLKGVNIDLAVMILDTPATDKDLLIFAIAEDAKLARHKAEIKYVFEHLHPTK